MKTRILSLAALLAFSATASAEVNYDANGVGFAGKGDVQDVFNWNNATLQANASSLKFQLVITSGASWLCSGVNPQGHLIVTTHGEQSSAVAATIAATLRKNGHGDVTGFNLPGADVATTQYTEAGTCPFNKEWQVHRTMVNGSLVYSSGTGPMLQVSADDGTTWFDLPVTPAL